MMKFILAAILMVPSQVQADTSICPKVGELAAVIMKSRQLDIPKSAVLDTVRYGPAHDLTIALIDLAYHSPVYPTTDMRATAVIGFQNQAEYLCYN